MEAIRTVFKIIGLGLALLVGQVVGGIAAGILLPAAVRPMAAHDGPFGLAQALLLMAAAYALVLAPYAARLRGGFASRATAVFVILYVVGSALSVIETVYYNAYTRLPTALIEQVALSGLIQSLIAAPAAAALWRGGEGEPETIPETIDGFRWRFALIVPLYILFYFGAGQFIAWQGAELRAYYAQGLHIDRAQVALLQAGRGLIWAGLVWMSVRQLTGSRWSRALIVGAVFSIVMIMPLLIPNPYMPWDVRKMHFVEMGTSNLLFGILAAWLLMSGMKREA
jgi:hypothetical protein